MRSPRLKVAFSLFLHPDHSTGISDTGKLRKGIELMSFLLMLEKFDVLQSSFRKVDTNSNTQKTTFYLGRNYFSYLLEPIIGEKNPVEDKRLGRILDRMLYSLEDEEWDTFIILRRELTQGIVRFFDFPVSGLPVE